MSVRVVLDTNVIISSYLTPHGRVARIVNLWEANALDLVTSEALLDEYARVLRYPRHRRAHQLSDTQLAEIDEGFFELTEVVIPVEVPRVIEEDPDDDHILAAADTARVDCVVSGDPHLRKLGVYKDIPILSPAEFLAQYFPE